MRRGAKSMLSRVPTSAVVCMPHVKKTLTAFVLLNACQKHS